ncbi:type II secretion system F family protein [Caminibacter pacificus]|uniref:General secretion pathway protein F/type IV pilus assembly protein PilC n=1 Tax=Caminibacter pacificus TaxID=1424653 RepID=A0AAJ4RBC0_9BACT|nr:type II secretion system F family protein [Caminibacter pacificus]QCI27408.1 type II secretion system F family protein [Caminibacter pacificus]ROR38845.1 general secretion pathway protein F/type IV pilus assembly protein PilC [Caminibacter pacificus]
MKFKYVGFNKEGKKVKGIIEASDIQEAKQKLSNIAIIDIKQKRGFNISFGSVKKSELAKILNVIGLYLKASIPLKKAINLAKNQTQNQKLQKFLSFIEDEIKEGKTLSEAIKNQKIIKLPPYIIHSIQIAQNSSNLDLILIENAKFLQEEDKINSKSTQALIYPSFIIIISLILVIVMMNTVVPKIIKIFQNLNQNLPNVTKITISISHFLQNNYILLSVGFIIALLAFSFAYKKVLFFRKIIDSLILKTPLLKRLSISKNLGRFSSLTYTLTNSGIHFMNAVNLASKTIDNEILKEKFQKALNEVLEGKKLSTSLKKQNFPDISFIEAIALIEETGESKNIMQNLKEIYLQEYHSKVSILLSLLEPIMILIVGGVIGFIVISMLLPIFSMNVMR